MPGTTYYDTTKGNSAGGFWRSDDVDILSKNNQHLVIQMESEEWLEYSINVSKLGFIRSLLYAAAIDGAIRFLIQGESVSDVIKLPLTKDQKLKTHSSDPLQLSKGDHILRLAVEQGILHLDSFYLRPFSVE